MIFERRGVWYAYDEKGKRHRFLSHQEALDFSKPKEKKSAEKKSSIEKKKDNVEEGLETEEASSIGLQQAEEDTGASEKVPYSFSKSWKQD